MPTEKLYAPMSPASPRLCHAPSVPFACAPQSWRQGGAKSRQRAGSPAVGDSSERSSVIALLGARQHQNAEHDQRRADRLRQAQPFVQ